MARLQSFFRLLRHPGERLGERRGGLHGSGSASARECSGPRPAQRLAESALVKERSLDLAEAAELFERAAEACEAAGDRASAAEYWSRASKQWSDMTYVPGTSDERAVAVNHKAIELGNRSVEADASQAWGHNALCVARGRLAMFTRDARAKVQLARQAQDSVTAALAANPDDDIAHHLLGRWHYEMASVNAFVRTMVHLLYGAALMSGSYAEALRCFSRADALAPGRAIHVVELGRVHARMGNRAAAAEALRRTQELPKEDINAVLSQAEALVIMSKLGIKVAAKADSAANPT